LNTRQENIIDILREHHKLGTSALQKALGLTRARIHQLVAPLIVKGLIKREGRARSTVYFLSEKRSKEQIIRENWELRRQVHELSEALEDRKVIERAKEILSAQFDIPPTEAYRKLQEQSMDSGRSMRQISNAILSAYEL